MINENSKVDLTEWHKWFVKYVLPVFKSQGRDEYFDFLKRVKPPFYPKFWVAERFYEKIKEDNRFDEELKMFFSFLYSCGFFMEYIIDYEDWLLAHNWENPDLSDTIEPKESIIEILNKPDGSNLLKSKLRWFPFLNRSEGY